MEDPRPQLKDALKAAMKARDNRRRDVIRTVQSAIKQVEVDTQADLTTEDVVALLQKEAKRRRESAVEFTDAGREDLAEQEAYEADVIDEFLPRQLDEAEIRAIVQEIIEETGASSPKDMGKVMGPVMARVRGLADGGQVNQIVREQLS
jgi:uncharacterized protein